jgi:methionine biosynthesis protein MetW
LQESPYERSRKIARTHTVAPASVYSRPAIADLVPAGSRVLDLGCGDGSLLAHLMAAKGCTGYGIEIERCQCAGLCSAKACNVLQLNLEEGLALFADNSFDVVLQIDTLQHLRNARNHAARNRARRAKRASSPSPILRTGPIGSACLKAACQ